MIYTIHEQLPVVLESHFLKHPQQCLTVTQVYSLNDVFKRLANRTQDFITPLRCSYVVSKLSRFVDIHVTIKNQSFVVNDTASLKYVVAQAAESLIELRKKDLNHGRGIVFTNHQGKHYNCSIPSPSILKHGYTLERLLSLLRLNGVAVKLEGVLVDRGLASGPTC